MKDTQLRFEYRIKKKKFNNQLIKQIFNFPPKTGTVRRRNIRKTRRSSPDWRRLANRPWRTFELGNSPNFCRVSVGDLTFKILHFRPESLLRVG